MKGTRLNNLTQQPRKKKLEIKKLIYKIIHRRTNKWQSYWLGVVAIDGANWKTQNTHFTPK